MNNFDGLKFNLSSGLHEILAHIAYFNFANIDYTQDDTVGAYLTSTKAWKKLLELAGINNIRWREDDCGEFWIADLVDENGHRTGLTGNYYDVDKHNQRLPPKLE